MTDEKPVSSLELAIMAAPRGTNYILLDLYIFLLANLQTPPATAPAFTILHQLILDPVIHIIQLNLVYRPRVKVTAAPWNPDV
jgi:hypothetical protein